MKLCIVVILIINGLFLFSSKAICVQKVLIVHSYDSQNATAAAQEKGIRKFLMEASLNLTIKTFYMDTKSHYTSPEEIALRGALARKEIIAWKPDVVIVIDDNACKEVMLKMVNSPYKFVFSGMNMPPEEYNRVTPFMETRKHPGRNITGVYEKLYIIASLKIAQQIFPNVKKAIIFTSKTPTGQAIRLSIKHEIDKAPSEFKKMVEIKTVDNVSEYISILKNLNETYTIGEAIICPLLDRLRTPNGYQDILEIVEYTIKHNRLPEVGGTLEMVQRGILGTVAIDFQTMGYQAGKKVVAILKGISPGEIPIEDAKGYEIIFNLKRVRSLGIKIPFNILLSANIIF